MRVLAAVDMGMCFGVRDALKALDGIATPSDVTIHGQLVHNEVVLQQLNIRGFHMVAESERTQIPESDTVLITAHGISRRERQRLTTAGKVLIDTTCPLVRRVHDTAMRLQEEGYFIVLIGRAAHVEVRGIVEDLQHYTVVESPAAAQSLTAKKIAVICQTTVAPRVVSETYAAIVAANPGAEIRFVDTTCQPTRNRQRALEQLIPTVQAMVVIGGSNSNNTRELMELCRQNGMKSWQVCDANDLRPEWFAGIDRVGVTAGTSTPDETIREVCDWLRTSEPGNSELPHVRSSAEWVAHFERNEQHQRLIPWELGAVVTPDEMTAIAASLRGWQLGETSDGSHLRAAARHYAESIGDPEFNDAVRLFIAEEQRHGSSLGRFLDLANVERARSDWGDSLFRAARYVIPRMEVWVTPVVMVETLALIYYNAIRRATCSPVLRAICEQILADEVPHIRFQCERLAILHRHRSPFFRAITMLGHRVLFTAITFAVWFGHHRALRARGYSFRRFWRAAWRKMNTAWRLMASEAYRYGPIDSRSQSNSRMLAATASETYRVPTG